MAEKKLGHINERLSDVAIQFPQDTFVGNNLFPEVPVNKGADEYTIFTKDNLFQVVDDTISKRGQARDVMHSSTTDEFVVKNRALRDFVAQEDIDNADDPLDPKIDSTETVTAAILLQREIRQQALAASLTVNTTTPGTKWDAANSTPIKDIEAAINAMFIRANTMILGRQVWDVLKFHPDLLAAFGGGYTGTKMASLDMLKGLFELDAVYVGGARKNTKKKPNTPSLSRVWGDGVHLAFVDNRKGRDVQTFGKTFAQKIGPRGQTFQTRTWRDESRGVGGGEFVQVEHRSVEKLVSEDFGYYISDTLT